MDKKIHIQHAPWLMQFQFFLKQGNAFAEPVTMKARENDAFDVMPTFSLSPEEAQNLMDELWFVGLRPTEGTGSAGALAATQDHLKTLKGVSDRLFRLIENPPVTALAELRSDDR